MQRRCAWCAVQFVTIRSRKSWTTHCSKRCSMLRQADARTGVFANSTRSPDGGRTRALAKARRRRLRHALTWDGITDQEILDRDRWTCGICRKKIGKTYTYPHPRSKSVDHVIPLAEGGDDTAVNKRAAHLGCNQRRGAKGGGEQLALISGLPDGPRVASAGGQDRRKQDHRTVAVPLAIRRMTDDQRREALAVLDQAREAAGTVRLRLSETRRQAALARWAKAKPALQIPGRTG